MYSSLEIACAEAGTNITKVCRAAGIARSTVTRWRKQEPASIRLYRKLLAEIEKEATIRKSRQPNTEND